MDGLKEHPIVLKNAVFFLEITLHLLSTYLFVFCVLLLNNRFFNYLLIVLSLIFNDIRCQRGCRGSQNSPAQHQGSPLSNTLSTESRLAVTYAKSKNPAPQPYNPRTLPPPELPPRAISPSSTTVSSSWHAGGQQNQGLNQETSPPRHNDQNATTNPLGRSHSAVMTSNIRMYFEHYIVKNVFQYICYHIFILLASPGKQVSMSSLQSAVGINSTNNSCSGSGTTISASSSSASDNRSPNNTLRVMGGITLSNAVATVSRATEKVFYPFKKHSRVLLQQYSSRYSFIFS